MLLRFPKANPRSFVGKNSLLTYLNSLQVVVVLDGMHCF